LLEIVFPRLSQCVVWLLTLRLYTHVFVGGRDHTRHTKKRWAYTHGVEKRSCFLDFSQKHRGWSPFFNNFVRKSMIS